MRHLHLFYAHYNVEGRGNKSRPVWFDYEKCFLNLLNTIKGLPNITLYVIMDGKIESNWISKYRTSYTLHETEGGSMEKVTHNVYSFIRDKDIPPEDLIYILENDYAHVNGWVEKVTTLFDTYKGLHYISLYDHRDKYFLPMYDDLVCKIFTTDNHHWRTTPSTCGSYITTSEVFKQDFDDHTGITVPIGDHHKWIFLNRTKGRFILSPVPGLSTHCMEGLLSPTVNWDYIIGELW